MVLIYFQDIIPIHINPQHTRHILLTQGPEFPIEHDIKDEITTHQPVVEKTNEGT